MNAQEFVNLLRTLNVLDTAATESLRGQAQVVNNQLSPQQILKSLLDAGQITRDQAKLVVANLQRAESQVKEEDEEGIVDLSQFGGEAEVEEVIDLDEFSADESSEEGSEDNSVRQGDYHPGDEEEDVNWGGVMIIGNALIFGLFCVLGVVLYVVLATNSATRSWESALKQYEGGSYQQAKSRMKSFIEEFPNSGNVNQAEIYSVLSEVNIQLVSVRKNSIEQIRIALLKGDTLPSFREEAEVELKSLMPRLAEY